MKARYTEYRCWPVIDTGASVERAAREEDAHFWGVYGVNPDGTEQHIGDALDKDSAESFAALLNWLRLDPLEQVLAQVGNVCNALGRPGLTLAELRPMLDRLEDALYRYDTRADREPEPDARDADERLTDTLTDLRKQAQMNGVNFYRNLERSLQHFIAEGGKI